MQRAFSNAMELYQRQNQTLNQQMIQSMNILAMSELELEAYFAEQELENPLLESAPAQETYHACCERGISRKDGSEYDSIENWLYQKRNESLEEYLNAQLVTRNLSAQQENAVRFLIGNLDERGYLLLHYEDVSSVWSKELYTQAVALLQSMEPCGVGARTLEECLLIQLQSDTDASPLLCKVAEKYLYELGAGQFHTIARDLHVSVAEVRRIRERLSLLNPKPGNGFGCGNTPVYVVPDVQIFFTRGNPFPQISLSEKYLPRFMVNQQYAAMLHSPDLSAADRQYVLERIRSAQWVLNCIGHRRQMILDCAKIIAEAQEAFFRSGSLPLRPLSMKDIAGQLDVHPSTISRVIRGKYIECKAGTFPASHFISRQVQLDFSGAVSRSEALHLLRCWIREEDKEHPLSDQALADRFHQKGIPLSRRTVAKYRGELGIPGAYARKETRD